MRRYVQRWEYILEFFLQLFKILYLHFNRSKYFVLKYSIKIEIYQKSVLNFCQICIYIDLHHTLRCIRLYVLQICILWLLLFHCSLVQVILIIPFSGMSHHHSPLVVRGRSVPLPMQFGRRVVASHRNIAVQLNQSLERIPQPPFSFSRTPTLLYLRVNFRASRRRMRRHHEIHRKQG